MDHSMHHPSSSMDDGSMANGMPMRCKMNMIWNTDPMGICLVFSSLQITSQASLVFYLVFLIALAMFYEYTRLSLLSFDRTLRATLRGAGGNSQLAVSGSVSTRYATSGNRRGSSMVNDDASGSDEALLGVGGTRGRVFGVVKLPWSIQTRRSLWYTINVALSFYIMLIIMSYNAVLIAAVLIGAFLGHFVFQRHFDLGVIEDDGKTLSCH